MIHFPNLYCDKMQSMPEYYCVYVNLSDFVLFELLFKRAQSFIGRALQWDTSSFADQALYVNSLNVSDAACLMTVISCSGLLQP